MASRGAPSATDPLGEEGRSFKQKLKDDVVKAARKLGGKGPAFGETKAPSDSKQWKQQGDGMIAKGKNEATGRDEFNAKAVDEFMENPSRFTLECAVAGLMAWYAGILWTFREEDACHGDERFNKLFPVLLVMGEWSAGTREGNKLLEEAGVTADLEVISEEVEGGDKTEAGDSAYIGGNGKQGGENVVVLKDGAVTPDSEVYGHGAGGSSAPKGVKKAEELARAYGGRINDNNERLKAGMLEKKAKGR